MKRFSKVMALLWQKFNILLLLLLIFISNGLVSAQEKPIIESSVPNTHFMVYQNGNSRQMEFADFKGKLIIIDFWATWCSSCIKKIPELQALQTQFKDRVQILMVSTESEVKIQAFLARRKQQNEPNIILPMVMADKELSALFPHQLLPHEVWISPDSKLYAITGADEVKPANIEKALAQQSLNAQSKVDIDASRPLFTVAELPLNGLENYSLLLKGYYPGLPSGTRYRKANGITYGIGISNFKLADLFFAVARQLQPGLLKKQMVMPANEPDLAEFFSFEFSIPPAQAAELHRQMLATLNQYSTYQGELKMVTKPCLVLKQIANTNLLRSENEAFENRLDSTNHLSIKKGVMSSLINRLNEMEDQPLMFIDETGLMEKIHIQIKLNPNPAILNQELKPYGLSVEESDRTIPMFYIKKKHN